MSRVSWKPIHYAHPHPYDVFYYCHCLFHLGRNYWSWMDYFGNCLYQSVLDQTHFSRAERFCEKLLLNHFAMTIAEEHHMNGFQDHLFSFITHLWRPMNWSWYLILTHQHFLKKSKHPILHIPLMPIYTDQLET